MANTNEKLGLRDFLVTGELTLIAFHGKIIISLAGCMF